MIERQPNGGWYDDPTGRHRLRYWDGSSWTAQVWSDGLSGRDALPSSSSLVNTATHDRSQATMEQPSRFRNMATCSRNDLTGWRFVLTDDLDTIYHRVNFGFVGLRRIMIGEEVYRSKWRPPTTSSRVSPTVTSTHGSPSL